MLTSYSKIRFLHILYWGIDILILFYFLFILSPGEEDISFLLGKALGVIALTKLTWQLVLSSRIRFLEKGVGLDRLMRWHKFNAKLVTTIVLIHPLLVFYTPLWLAGLSLVEIIQEMVIPIWLGATAVLLIAFTITITLYGYMLKLNYEHWKVLHNVGYVIVLLGFLHSLFVGTEIMDRGVIFYWWILLAFIALYAFLHRNVFRWLRWRGSMYEINRVVNEAKGVRSFYLKPVKDPGSEAGMTMRKFDYAPGQFAFTRFYSKDLSTEEHHFTLSSSPRWDQLSFTIKESGDFTSQLGIVKEGDRLQLEGPYGVFSNQGMHGPFVFIAGGIGITPLMSMLRTMKEQASLEKTLLFYAVRTREDLVFKEELEALDLDSKWFRMAYIFSEERIDGAYHGYLTKEILEKEISAYNFNIADPTFFICGPPPMMDGAQKVLVSLGVEERNIFTERFALR